MPDARIVIVGAGHAGVQCAASIKEAAPHLPVMLIDTQDDLPYERPPLSKEVLQQGAAGAMLLRGDDFYAQHGIDLQRGTSVTGLDRHGKTVNLADGRAIAYDKAVIATGARARALPLPGAELAGVHVLRTRFEALAIFDALRAAPRVVVIGAGYIGLEVAAAAASAGCSVTVLETQDRVMSRVTSEPVSRYFESLHRDHGVAFEFGAQVQALEGEGKVRSVVMADGRRYDADIVIAGVGIAPNQELAQQCGIACSDGILVDAAGRTSDPDVYAIGDVSRRLAPGAGAGLRLECVQGAVAQARAAAADIAGTTAPAQEVPWFWTTQYDVRLQSAGIPQGREERVVRGDPHSGRFSVLYLDACRLAAIDTVGSLKDFLPAKRLIASGASLRRDAAADPSVRLADALHTSPSGISIA